MPPRFLTSSQTLRFAMLAAVFSATLALAVGCAIEFEYTRILLGQLAVRAADHVELEVMDDLTRSDFEPPYSQAKLDEISVRLRLLLVRVRREGSGIVRTNLFAKDGTIVYSDLASLRGQVLSPEKHSPLARALSGAVGAEAVVSDVPEVPGLVPFGAGSFAAYAPVKIGGEVIGAYEFYVDAASIRLPVLIVWGTVAGGFGLLFLVLLVSAQLTFRGPRGANGLTNRELVTPGQRSEMAGGGTNGLSPGRESNPEGGAPISNEATQSSLAYSLTRRELEVIRLMATKRSYSEIASELVIGEETVRTHAKSILRKLRQPDRARAVAVAAEAGLLSLGVTPGDERGLPSGEPGVTPVRSPNSPLNSDTGDHSIGHRIVRPVEVTSSVVPSP